MNRKEIRILLIEDNPGDARLIQEMLVESKGIGCLLEHVESLSAGSKRIEQGDIDVVLLDLCLPDSAGLDTLRRLHAGAAQVPAVVIMSGFGDEEIGVQAVQEGAQDYLVKGRVDSDLLIRSIRYAVERRKAEEALQRAHDELENQVRQRTARLAQVLESLEKENTERKRAEEALKLNSERAEALLRLNQMTRATLGEIMEFGFEEAVKLTKSRIGFLGFVNEDESILEVRVWSSGVLPGCGVTGSPLRFTVAEGGLWAEAVRQRRIFITNDYDAPNPLKKGCPQGHVRIHRYMGIPVAVEGRIVLLAGVANKESDYDETDVQQLTLLMEGMWRLIERKRSEEERVRLAAAIEQAAEAIFITGTDWIIRYVNPALEHMTGYERGEIIGHPARILRGEKQDKALYGIIRDTLARGEAWSGRLTNKKKDGTLYDTEVTGSPVRDESGEIINHVVIYRDITHEVRLERELRQAHKMEAIGTLAGGIAHDFNNILAAIIGYAELAHSRVRQGSPERHYLDQVLTAGSRAKDLIGRILTFSRQSEHERRPVHVASVVMEALKLLRSSLPTTIEIRQDMTIAEHAGIILADPVQVHQVLMNLCANAAQAMRAGPGILSVGLAQVEVDAHFIARHPDLKPGTYVRLTVSDTGLGMDAAVMERIFDPYFTTKEIGEGTGMGLSVVQGIVKSHGGTITVYSEPGKGATFNVFLPVIEERISQEAAPVQAIPAGNERILFVDDEKVLADLGKEMLESLGYHLTVITNSLDALKTFRAGPDAFDLVITDMTMPGMTGIDLANNLMAIRQDIPVILCTGFSESINEKQAKEAGIREFVMKPYVIGTIARIIRKVLEENRKA